MPLYDCVLLLKPTVQKEARFDLVSRVWKHVYKRNGVVTDVKSFGTVQLGYGVRKLDGRYYQGQLLQMTMMTPPSMNSELQYLNREDRLLRWLLIKNRGTKCLGLTDDSDISFELGNLKGVFTDGEIFKPENFKDDEDDDDDDVDEEPESGDA